ncbi:MAG: prephenate dehydrogenase/arogenate dehydrogenase family protein, partial [Halioglobus sp.]|nr:prephenate dehydrogenase/arogenate dehydrogenase family protein [Halioglobus sp.]
MDLEKLRAELSGIDRQLVELIARRQQVVARIGKNKLSTGRATRDYKREKEVLSLAREHAQSLSVDPKVVESIMTALIRTSLASQERDRVVAEGYGAGRSVLVIGGAGKMGAWFAEFFASQGYSVTVADTAIDDGDGRFHDWRDAGVDFDVIVVAAPLAITGTILQDLAALKPRGVVFDIGSLKSPLRKGLQALQKAGVTVASLHPMFGPDTDLLSGKHLIFVDAGSAEATRMAKEMFRSTMVRQLDMDMDD